MNSRRYLKQSSIYRHYKGDLYYVRGLAEHSETGEQMVVYHALDGENNQYARPAEMFLSEVEEGKENPTGQRYRFEYQEIGERIN